jgi:hypothetical protein
MPHALGRMQASRQRRSQPTSARLHAAAHSTNPISRRSLPRRTRRRAPRSQPVKGQGTTLSSSSRPCWHCCCSAEGLPTISLSTGCSARRAKRSAAACDVVATPRPEGRASLHDDSSARRRRGAHRRCRCAAGSHEGARISKAARWIERSKRRSTEWVVRAGGRSQATRPLPPDVWRKNACIETRPFACQEERFRCFVFR